MSYIEVLNKFNSNIIPDNCYITPLHMGAKRITQILCFEDGVGRTKGFIYATVMNKQTYCGKGMAFSSISLFKYANKLLDASSKNI